MKRALARELKPVGYEKRQLPMKAYEFNYCEMYQFVHFGM